MYATETEGAQKKKECRQVSGRVNGMKGGRWMARRESTGDNELQRL